MHPDLFTVPGTSCVLHTYGLMIMAAFAAAVWSGGRLAKSSGVSKELVMDLGIVALFSGILGAKINYLIQYPQDLGAGSPLFDLSDGGLSPLGALVGGSLPYAAWLLKTRKEKSKMSAATFGIVAAATIALAVVGARVWHVVEFRGTYGDRLWDVVLNLRQGFVLYGGLIGGIFCGVLYIRWKKESVLKVGDVVAPGIVLAIGIGRLGCFMQGCCYGGRTDLPWAVTFPKGSMPYEHHLRFEGLAETAARSFGVHPTQMYEFLVGVGIFLLLQFLYKRRKHHGEILLTMGICYATWRFVVENLRMDERPRWVWNLTYSQWVSIAIFVGCALILTYVKRRPANVSAAPS